ncbi:hypothetical protein EJB05_42618, partial [Eragrostis curvula]
MATARRHRRSDKQLKGNKRSPKQRREARPAPAGPTSVHDVPDPLLELILVRLHSSACLLRAAAACKRWRRFVADAGFISRFRSFRAAPVAGYYHTSDPFYARPPSTGDPTFVPSLPVDRGRFSLDFLPDGVRDSSWELADSRGSLLLLARKRLDDWSGARLFPDLVVCEPLTRRHQGILRPVNRSSRHCIGVFLLDDGTGDVSMPSFRVLAVLCMYDNDPLGDGLGKPLACVFTSGSDGGGWRTSASAGSVGVAAANIALPRTTDHISFVGRANGALHWEIGDVGALLSLDEATATTFSLVPLPADAWSPYRGWCLRVVGGGEDGALRVVHLINNDLKVFVRLRSDDGGWVLEKLLRLPEATRGLPGHEDRFFRREAMIVDAHDTYVLVTPQEETWLFSVELETMAVEREHERNRYAGASYPCQLPWPPALEACPAHRGRRRCR